MKKYIFSIAILSLLWFNSSAQKYGYVNSGNIIAEITGANNSDQILKDYSQPLIDKGEKMIEKFNANKDALYDEVNKGILSQVAIQQRQNALAEEQNTIAKYEQEVSEKIAKKREEVLGPILERIQKAINDVAKEEGYSMIFDASIMNALLYVEETGNIEPQVRVKLGI